MRHLRIYRAIQLISRAGSIRKAAESLMISPSALNRSVLAFEEELGVDVFERLPSGVRLSVPGELLLRHIDEHISRMDDYQSLISEMQGGQSGVLRLSVSGDISETLLGAVLARFRQDHPGLSTEVIESYGCEALQLRHVDIALVTWPRTEPDLDVILTHPLQIGARLAAGHPCAGGVLDLSDLTDHRLILPPDGSGLRVTIDQALRRFRLSPRDLSQYPRLLHQLSLDPVPEVQFHALTGADPVAEPGIAHASLPPGRFAPVQMTLLRRREGQLPRVAELFVSALHRHLEAGA